MGSFVAGHQKDMADGERGVPGIISTSQKHRSFVNEPMGDKPVTDLAGIGPVLGDRLVKDGYRKVSFLLHSLHEQQMLMLRLRVK